MIRTLTLAMISFALAAAGCGGGHSSKSAGSPYMGMTSILLTDGPIQVVNDTRTIVRLEIDITRVALESAGDDLAGEDDADDVLVFDTARGDNGGNPLTVDLLSLADSSVLLGQLNVPVGTYEEAELTVSAARAEFEDDPGVLVLLALGREGEGPAGRFEFEFDPPVTVTADGMTVAVIDFVPVVTKVGDQYVLTHDDIDDETGEVDEQMEIRFTGPITAVSDDHNTISVSGISESIDVSAARVEADDLPDDKSSLAVGQLVEVEGSLDPTLGVVVAEEVKIQDPDQADAPEEVRFSGTIATVSDDHTTITVSGISGSIDVSTAQVDGGDLADSASSLAAGQAVEVRGILDPSTSSIVADEVKIEN
jgi:hypothetical protein